MESTIEHIQNLVSKTTELAENKIELLKLKTAGKVAESASTVITLLVMVIIAGVAFSILSFGVAYWIGYQIGSVHGGFFILGGFYLVAGILVFIFRKQLFKTPVSNVIIDKIIE